MEKQRFAASAGKQRKLSAEYFYSNKTSKDGLWQPCKKTASKAYREADPEKSKARSKAWREANPEKVKTAAKDWYADNTEKS